MCNKVNILIIIVALAIAVSGCSASAKPETMVSEFIEGMKKFDLELMASKINPSDSDGKESIYSTVEDDEDQFQKYFLEYIKTNAKKISYKINETEISEDKAVVNVAFKYIDGGNLFRATMAEFIKDAFALAFSGVEVSDEENTEMFITVMKEQQEIMDEKFVEKTIDIECIKIDNKWYIDNPSDEILDVMMSNILSMADEMADSFDTDYDNSEVSDTVMGQIEADNMNVIESQIGEEITLATIKLKVTDAVESQTLTASYGSPTPAKDGAKFVLLSLEVTNITKSEFALESGFTLVDNEGREFSAYSDALFSIDDSLEYANLSPSIKETGRIVYEVPFDSTNYFIVIGKAGTNDIYKINIK